MKPCRVTTWLLLVAGFVGACGGPVLGQDSPPYTGSRLPPSTPDLPYAQRYGVVPDPLLSPTISRMPPPGNVDAVFQGDSTVNPWSDAPPETPTLGQRVYNLMPEGMIPYIGPRTPEDRRHSGLGDPLEGMSWLDHQESAGAFTGVIFGATSSVGKLDPGAGEIFGLRFCWDYDHRWGLEKRFGFAQMYTLDLDNRVKEIVNLEMGDVDLMFYPWGESRWRPYIMTGIGAANFNYQDVSGNRTNQVLLGLPFGIGLKYLVNDGVSIRLDVVDNLMLGTGDITTMNNMSITFGLEFRFDLFGGHAAVNQTY